MIRKHFIPLGLQVAFGFGAFMALIASTHVLRQFAAVA